jgi:hypothetical protein
MNRRSDYDVVVGNDLIGKTIVFNFMICFILIVILALISEYPENLEMIFYSMCVVTVVSWRAIIIICIVGTVLHTAFYISENII